MIEFLLLTDLFIGSNIQLHGGWVQLETICFHIWYLVHAHLQQRSGWLPCYKGQSPCNAVAVQTHAECWFTTRIAWLVLSPGHDMHRGSNIQPQDGTPPPAQYKSSNSSDESCTVSVVLVLVKLIPVWMIVLKEAWGEASVKIAFCFVSFLTNLTFSY